MPCHNPCKPRIHYNDPRCSDTTTTTTIDDTTTTTTTIPDSTTTTTTTIPCVGPSIEITAPAEGWYKDSVTVSHTTDGTVCEYRYINDGSASAWSSITCNQDFSFDTNNCIDGEAICVIEIRAANGCFKHDSVTFSVDNSPPIITYVSVNPNPVRQNTNVEITSDGHDPQGLKSCWAFLISGTTTIESYNLGLDCADTELIPDVPDGDYIIRVRARNNVDTDSFEETELTIDSSAVTTTTTTIYSPAPPAHGNPPTTTTIVTGATTTIESTTTTTPTTVPATTTVFTCEENWFCDNWSTCVNETQTRACVDLNGCGTVEDKPLESQACLEERVRETNPGIITGMLTGSAADPFLGIVILLVLVLIYILYKFISKLMGK